MQRTEVSDQVEPDWEMSFQDWLAVIGAAIGCFMAILDIQITNASIREIQAALGLDFSEGSWISTSYLISEIVVIPLTAFFSKVFGLRRYILWNTLIFIIASILCGLAWSLPALIFARVLQGLSGGTLIPLAFQVILLYMPPHRKNFGLALFGLISTLAPTLGPSFGGYLTDMYGWRSIFLINIFPGLLMIAFMRAGLPKAKIFYSRLKTLDKWGMLTLALGLSALTYMLEEGARVEWFEDVKIKICMMIVLLALPAFIVIELTVKHPLLNLRLFMKRNFGFTAFITMLTAMALYGGIYALSLYLGQVQSYSAGQIGKVMMWAGLPQLLVMPFVPFLLRKLDARILAVIGLGLFALSNLLNAHLNTNYSGDQFVWSLIIRAVGQPLFIIPLSAIGMGMITPSEAGSASAIYNVLRNLGGSIGIAITSTFAISRESLHVERHLEKLGSTDLGLTQALKGLQYHFMSSGGMDFVNAKNAALRVISLAVHKESLYETFSDVFHVLCFSLLICLFCSLFLKKVKFVSGSQSTMHID